MTILQPSTFLPRVSAKGSSSSAADLADVLGQLRRALAATQQLDHYERTYAQTWLTRLFTVCQDDELLDEAGDLLALATNSTLPGMRFSQKLRCFFATAEQSVLAETNRSGSPYIFDSPQGREEITIEESYMQDVHATGFQTWSSAIHLAKRIFANPSQFFQTDHRPASHVNRVLEIGSGTGLAGIAAARAMKHSTGYSEVVLSDMDQSTLDTLHKNVLKNDKCPDSKAKVRTSIIRLDWTEVNSSTLSPFDIIIGADIIYEPEHADLVYAVVNKLLARNARSVFHLMLVARPTHGKDIAALEERFGGLLVEDSDARPAITKREEIESTVGDIYPYPHRYYEIRWEGLPES